MTSQDHRMAAILLRLELVSTGSTQAWNPSGGQSGEPDDKAVAQVGSTFPHLVWRERYGLQVDDLGRERIITDAGKELESWTRRTAPRIEGKSLVELILEDGKGYDPKVVAERYGVDVAFVRRKRMVAGCGTEDGKDVVPDTEPTDRPERARELRQKGMSTRQIALVLGCHQTQVMRWVKDRSARAV